MNSAEHKGPRTVSSNKTEQLIGMYLFYLLGNHLKSASQLFVCRLAFLKVN